MIFEMDGDNAARPDDFTGQFFVAAWEVVAQDVYRAVVSFFYGAELARFVTATSIVLLSKTMNPNDFRSFGLLVSVTFLIK